jgi:aminoglycoside phosphotransferase (APT) family kinase protein
MIDALRPHLEPSDRAATPNVLDVGFSSTVIRFGASVARVARNRDAAAGHAREAATLRVVDGRVPVAVPTPLRLIAPGAHLPFGAALQPFLPGRMMRPEDLRPDATLPRSIAGTLASLHQLDAGMFPDGALLELDALVELHRLAAAAVPWVREHLSAPLRRSFDDAWGRCAEVLPGRERVVCHGDAWFGNMLVRRGRLAVLLDWEEACVADPCLDLAAQRHPRLDDAEATISAYLAIRGPLEDLEARIQACRQLREVASVDYVLRNDITEEFDEEIAKVTHLLAE